jgi:hypothetical protein
LFNCTIQWKNRTAVRTSKLKLNNKCRNNNEQRINEKELYSSGFSKKERAGLLRLHSLSRRLGLDERLGLHSLDARLGLRRDLGLRLGLHSLDVRLGLGSDLGLRLASLLLAGLGSKQVLALAPVLDFVFQILQVGNLVARAHLPNVCASVDLIGD